MRKIVQIAAISGRLEEYRNEKPPAEILESVFALCDDGSVWVNEKQIYPAEWYGWYRLEEIPQDDPEEGESD